MSKFFALVLPVILALGLTPSVQTYEATQAPTLREEPKVEDNIVLALKTPQTATSSPIGDDKRYCSCVRAAKEVFPELPLWNASDFRPTGTRENSELVILRYKAKNSNDYVYHLAPYKLGTSTLHIYNEGNFEECQKTERDIALDDEHILGYWDYDLWLKIKNLPADLFQTLNCESQFQHYEYKSDAIMQGPSRDYGLGQFTRKTWNWFNESRAQQGLKKLYEIFDPFEQIEMLSWAWNNNLKDHWICYQKLFGNPPSR